MPDKKAVKSYDEIKIRAKQSFHQPSSPKVKKLLHYSPIAQRGEVQLYFIHYFKLLLFNP